MTGFVGGSGIFWGDENGLIASMSTDEGGAISVKPATYNDQTPDSFGILGAELEDGKVGLYTYKGFLYPELPITVEKVETAPEIIAAPSFVKKVPDLQVKNSYNKSGRIVHTHLRTK